MLVGREMEIKDDLTWNPPPWSPRGARGEITSSTIKYNNNMVKDFVADALKTEKLAQLK